MPSPPEPKGFPENKNQLPPPPLAPSLPLLYPLSYSSMPSPCHPESGVDEDEDEGEAVVGAQRRETRSTARRAAAALKRNSPLCIIGADDDAEVDDDEE